MTAVKKILVLGASGMLGNAMLRVLADAGNVDAFGSTRSVESRNKLPASLRGRVVAGVDVESADSLVRLFGTIKPDVVINGVGLVKQLAEADDPLSALPINALLPHRLARLCEVAGAKLIHFSTDCVFSGSRGMYTEADFPDANDLYGRSKYLGEVAYPHALTLRTSIIGHELGGARSLIGWFLAQKGPVRGFTKAIFSGLPTVEVAHVVRDHVLPRLALTGLYHLAAEPITKFDLLGHVAETYRMAVQITPDDSLVIDRSLDSTRFRAATGYVPPTWHELVHKMHDFR
jgi:dTDP-4-dehydrorhamnose reductase